MKFSKQNSLSSIALLLFSAISLANAETAPAPDAGLLMRETRELPETAKHKPEVTIENAERQRRPMPSQKGLQITVQSFLLSGNTQFTAVQLLPLLDKYKGHPVGFYELQAAANLIADFYRKAGYFVTLAYLPTQSLKNGVVEIVILEGNLDSSHLNGNAIKLIGDTRINKSVLQRFINTKKTGELVTDKNSSHLSLLINDLPGIQSVVVLSAGSTTGTSALTLKVKEGPLLSGYVSTDNHGLYSTGYYRFDGSLNINDPFGLGDQLSLRVQTTDTGGSVMGAANYNAPINGYGTSLAVNFSQLDYSLGRSYEALQADGMARTLGTSLIHPLYLTRDTRLFGTAHYEHRWLQDDINAFDNYNQREIDVMSFSFRISAFDNLLLTNGLTQAYISLSAGRLSFTNQAAAQQDSLALNSTGGYHKFTWKINRTQDVWNNDIWGDISMYINFSGQVASKNIDSSEQMSFGGPNAIRAYPVGEGSADEGWLFNAETRYSLPRFESVPGRLQIIGFIDSGYSRVNASPLAGDLNNSRHLTGYGVGVNWLGAAGFTLRTSVAWRDANTQPTSDPTASEPQVYFQLTQTF
ncbi:ShlB/FhaC/HecB family hemolysin secretion/activation protein [Neptunomonas antarctica]|uniref:Hemolysin activation/secretion protein n=1 Tax=Neptunomonas antarctica TaxID=619304 RepID=A0A1N7IZR4_9GAMM|nr:ShlB/FhaC/HecB family hemolysin secretion/activation protein [Neptunomonas antarctica]SIS42593.1 Hemolysin activation/secretion protein [Neptunomonas antarctica]